MAFDYSRFGTRITLSDRFTLIRKEAQKREIVVNQTIGQPVLCDNKTMKNFNNTISSDRPSAALQQGSEKNRRLVLHMAAQPSVLAEINWDYNPEIKAQLPNVTPKINVRQRLGLQPVKNKAPSTSNIKNRLGVTRTPIAQRIGNINQTKSLPAKLNKQPRRNIVINRFNNKLVGNQLKARQTTNFKRKNVVVRKNLNPKFNKPRQGTILKGRKGLLQKRKPVTADQLDHDLESYMQKTKGALNADLDAYMAQ